MKSLKSLYKIGYGPSSSHTMGPSYAAHRMKEQFPSATKYEVILYGSLALTGKGHLTDEVLLKTLGADKTKIIFDYETQKNHPNTLIIKAFVNNKWEEKEFISIGGGSLIEDNNIDEEEEIYPFKSFLEIKEYAKFYNVSLSDIVYQFEDDDIKEYLNKVYETMKEAIERGLKAKGTLKGGLNLERKAHYLINPHEKESKELREVRMISSYAYATSEENASGGLIVTSPTCGACGVLPSVLYYLENTKHLSRKKIIDALSVAGLIGNVVRSSACISGAYAGCQSEIGTACSMAAAAASFINKCSIEEIECAAEMAMEHHLGLTCDPVLGLVQIPCIERNAASALRAIDAARLASFLANSRQVSFDTIVNTMYETGKDMRSEYKETSIGGLAKYYKNKK